MAEKIFENLPVRLNLGDPEPIVGWAHAHKTDEGEAHIHITLHKDETRIFDNLVEIFDLVALGFASVKRRPPDAKHVTSD